MQFIQPKIFHVGQTTLDNEGVQAFLDELGVPDWDTDAPTDQEKSIELSGKLCYLSFAPEILNKNVKKITENNTKYIGNILKQKHGSVMEHETDSYILFNVSRVLTHEVVRHRAGTAFSQVSGRYVRVDDISMYMPEVFSQLSYEYGMYTKAAFQVTVELIEQAVKKLYKDLEIDSLTDFNLKKKITSAVRRLAPNGGANHIRVTANSRAWRHMIEMRTSEHAEEEIRIVFSMIYHDLAKRYPNIYQDAETRFVNENDELNNIVEVKFKNSKI